MISATDWTIMIVWAELSPSSPREIMMTMIWEKIERKLLTIVASMTSRGGKIGGSLSVRSEDVEFGITAVNTDDMFERFLFVLFQKLLVSQKTRFFYTIFEASDFYGENLFSSWLEERKVDLIQFSENRFRAPFIILKNK